jgi:hypothetical protein
MISALVRRFAGKRLKMSGFLERAGVRKMGTVFSVISRAQISAFFGVKILKIFNCIFKFQ